MTDLPVVDRSVSFVATGGETILDVDWPIASSTELTVARTRNGTTTTLLEVTDYTVDGVGSSRGAQVRLVLAAEQGDAYLVTGLEGAGTEGSGSQFVTFVLARWRGAFALSTLYRRGDAVEADAQSYVALVSHVSSSTDAPGSGPSWAARWALVAAKGGDGNAGTIAIGTVTTGEPGSSVEIENVGTASAAILNITIPAGQDGEPGEGEDGDPGPGLPAGGTAGQIARKIDGADYNTEWTDNLPTFGVNTSPDSTNRLAAKSDAVLFSHDDVTPGTGDQRTVLNKASTGKTASFLFQSNFSGRAEIGLTGNDDFSFKVSPDGAAWSDALVLKKDGSAIAAGVPVQHGKPPKLPAYTISTLPSASTYGAGSLIYVSDWPDGGVILMSDGIRWRRAQPRKATVADLLGGDEGIAIDFRAREALINDYADVLTATGRPADVLTLTRASDATFVGRNGLLETAGSNALRFTCDPVKREPRGLLVEGAATNLHKRSQTLGDWTQLSEMSVTADADAAPDGTTTADLLVPSTNSGSHFIRDTIDIAITSGKTYTASVFAKDGGYENIRLAFDGTTIWADGIQPIVNFNSVDGSFYFPSGTISYRAIQLANGWWRAELTVTAASTTNARLQIWVLNPDGTNNGFAGDGASGVLVWGAQVEEGAVASSYIPTTTATASRAADSLTIGPDTFPVQTNGACTLHWRGRIRQLCASGEGTLLSADDGTSDEVIELREGTSLGGVNANVIDGGSAVADTASHAVASDDEVAVALGMQAYGLVLYGDGTEVATDWDMTAPAIDQLTIAPGTGSVYEIYAVAYIARALGAAALAALSTV
jgi:hypothetical protein